MNPIPFPPKPLAETAPEPEFEPYYSVESAPIAEPAHPVPEPSALDTMYAYFDAA